MITYKQVGIDVRVYLDKARVGTIKSTTAGWVYYPIHSKTGSEPHPSFDAVRRSLEHST
jgi:hypothetical protein